MAKTPRPEPLFDVTGLQVGIVGQEDDSAIAVRLVLKDGSTAAYALPIHLAKALAQEVLDRVGKIEAPIATRTKQ